MSDASAVSLVCCDVRGAAAVDGSVLERAFLEAIATQGVVTGTAAYVKAMVQFDRARGWSPADVMHTLFPEDEIRAQGREPGLRAVVPGRDRPVRCPPAAGRGRCTG
jgi:phosphoglycolate phosphatase